MSKYNDDYFDKELALEIQDGGTELREDMYDSMDFDSAEEYEEHMTAFDIWHNKRFSELHITNYAFEFNDCADVNTIKNLLKKESGKLIRIRITLEAEIDTDNAAKLEQSFKDSGTNDYIEKYEIMW